MQIRSHALKCVHTTPIVTQIIGARVAIMKLNFKQIKKTNKNILKYFFFFNYLAFIKIR